MIPLQKIREMIQKTHHKIINLLINRWKKKKYHTQYKIKNLLILLREIIEKIWKKKK